VLPGNRSQTPGKPVFDFPENRATKIHVRFHETHSAILRPTLLIVIPDNILIIGVWIFRQESLHQISRILRAEPKYKVHFLNVSAIKPYRVSGFYRRIFESHKFIGHVRSASQLTGPWQTQDQKIQNHCIELENETRKLKPVDQPVTTRVIHILIVYNHIIFTSHIIRQIMFDDQPQKSIL
jgi:hypothetical protein